LNVVETNWWGESKQQSKGDKTVHLQSWTISPSNRIEKQNEQRHEEQQRWTNNVGVIGHGMLQIGGGNVFKGR
jgi:hypothetical protein